MTTGLRPFPKTIPMFRHYALSSYAHACALPKAHTTVIYIGGGFVGEATLEFSKSDE